MADWAALRVPADAAGAPARFSELLRDATNPTDARMAALLETDASAAAAAAAVANQAVPPAVEAPSAQRLLLSLLWMVNNHNHTAGRDEQEFGGGAHEPASSTGLPRGKQLKLTSSDDGHEVWLGVHSTRAPA